MSTSFTTCVCLSLVRKGISSATVNPCALLLLLIWYTNFIMCVLDLQSNCISVIVAHVKFVSALVMCGIAFLCVVVTACSMSLVGSSHCLVIQHNLYAFVSPTIFSNCHFPSSCEFANVYKLHTSLQTLTDTHRWNGVTTLHLRLPDLCTC